MARRPPRQQGAGSKPHALNVLALAAAYREAVEALQTMLDDCDSGAYSNRNASHARAVLAKAKEMSR